jgi:hypothetical protein
MGAATETACASTRESTFKTAAIGFTPTAGNKLVAICGAAATFSIPSGWSRLANRVQDWESVVFVKVSDGTETSMSWTQNAARQAKVTFLEFPSTYLITALGGWQPINNQTQQDFAGSVDEPSATFIYARVRASSDNAQAGITYTTTGLTEITDGSSGIAGFSDEAVHLYVGQTTFTDGPKLVSGSLVASTATVQNPDAIQLVAAMPIPDPPEQYQLVPDTLVETAAAVDTSSYQLGQEFTVTSNAWIKAIKFYRPVTNANALGLDARTWVVKLWQNSQPIGSGTVTTVLNQTGWITAILESPIAITTGVTYNASYHVPANAGYAIRAAYLASGLAPGGANPLVAGAGSGKFREGGGHTVPTTAFNNSFYFITPVIVTSAPAGVLNNLWTVPSAGQLAVPETDGPYELGMRYTVTNASSLVAVRFFRAATESAGNNTVRVWDSGGTQLSSATTSTVVNGGYITVPLPSPVALSAGQQFTVSVNNYTVVQINVASGANNNRTVPNGVVRGNAINVGGPGVFPATTNTIEYYIQPILA